MTFADTAVISGECGVNVHKTGALYSAGSVYGNIVKAATSSVVEISGGTYTQDVSAWCVDGYTCVANGDGTYSVVLAVAKIGDTYYSSIADAFAAGGEITLLTDVSISSTLRVASGKTVVLDLNGYTIDGTEKVRIAIMSYGDLTIKDSSAAQNGTIKAGIGTAGNAINICAGTFTLESGNIYSKNNVLLIDEQAAVINIKGGKLTAETATRNSAVMYVSSTSNTVINVTAGELVGYNGILLWNNTEVNVSGGTITATGSTGIQGNGSKDNTKITISGGEISGYWAAIYHPQGGELNISGGTLTGYTGVVVKGGNVTISGGTINGTGAADTYRPVSSGYVDTGDALYVEHYDNSQNSENYGTPVVTITGGTFTSVNGKAVASYANTNNSVEALASFVSGGTFNTDVSDLCADGFICEQNADGTYGVEVDPAFGKVAMIGDAYYVTLADAIAAAQDGDVITLLADAEISATTNISKSITIDGNGFALTQATGFVANGANVVFDIFGNATVTFKNLTFDAIKNVGVIRTVNANLVMDNCTIQNSEQTVSQGLLRLACGNATITNSKFLNNKCNMVVTFGYDAANSSDVLLIDGCTFEGNTCGDTAVVYFADGDYAKVTDTKFVDNVVSATGNAATLYLGWGSGFEVSGCYFDGNSVTTTHATTKRFASAIFCDGCNVNGNVFGNNTAVRNGQTVSTAVAVGAYYGAANIDGNYWVDGSMPANGVVYTVEYTRNPVTLNNYYTDYSVNADGSVVLGGFDKMPAGSVAYRAYITDSTSREAIQIDLSNVYAKNSFVIKLYDANGNLLTTTTYRNGGVDAASFTCNIVLWGSASSSWNTEIHADLTAANAPAKAEIYADGILVDSYQHTSGSILADKLDAYMNLDCVYKVVKVNSTYYVSLADAFAAAQDGDVITLLADVEVSDVILVNKSVTINGNGYSITSSANRVIRLTTSNIEVTVNDLNMVNTKASSYIADIRGISIDAGLSNVKLTLNNSSVDFTDATAIDWSYAVNVSGNGTGHTVTINGGTYEGANVVNAHGANNTIIVKNATLTSLYPNSELYTGACIWVLQNQNSSVEATNNTFNGANALAFNLGTGTVLNESNNIDNTTYVVAKIGSTYYVSLAEALAVGGNVTLLADIALSESVAVNGTVVLDLNGHVITGTDNTTKNFGLINNNGTLTVKDSVGTGKITLTATVNSGWGRYSAVISNNPGGTLVVESGVIEHLGGTDMAYGIDSLTNGNIGDVSVTINGGTIKSTYRAIRQFLNSTTAKNDLVINGGTVEGANNGVFFQDPSAKANLGSITIGANADVSGVYLFVTEGSAEWPVTVSINKDAVSGEVTSKNVPAGYAVVESNGVYGVDVLDVKINDTYYATIADAIADAQAGDVLVLQDNVEYNSVLSIMKDVTLDLNGFELKAAGIAIFANDAGIVDNGSEKGLLAVPHGFLIVGRSAKSMLPVWNEAETGYVFVEVAAKNQITAIDEDSFKIVFRPEFDSAANAADFFKDGSSDNDITISIQINCIKNGEVVTLGFSAPQGNIESIYSNNKAMSLTVNGAGSNFESYEIAIVLTSDTGLVYSYVAGSFSNGVYTPAV